MARLGVNHSANCTLDSSKQTLTVQSNNVTTTYTLNNTNTTKLTKIENIISIDSDKNDIYENPKCLIPLTAGKKINDAMMDLF